MLIRTCRRASMTCLWLMITFLLPSSSIALQRASDENARQFDQIVRTIRDRFYDPHFNGADWTAISARYRSRAMDATSKSAFQAVINRMLDELHASHLGYYTDDDFEYYLLQSLFKNDMEGYQIDHIGVLGERQGNAFVVRAVLDGSPAARAGIRVDDRLVSADGAPFTTVGSFRGKQGASVRIQVERQGAGTLSVNVTPVRQNPQRAMLDATVRSARVIERGGLRLGYVHLWAMTNNRFRYTLDDLLGDKLANTDGLILDIRDGFGGEPFGFGDVLFRPDVTWRQSTREHGPDSSHTAYTRPVVLLINNGTRSAKEYLTYQFRKAHRGVIVGTNTAGAFLGAGGEAIPPDGYLELPVSNLWLDGRRLEGVGVSPDVEVQPRDTYSAGDRQLDTALNILTDRIRVDATGLPGSKKQPATF